jgi:hypothetical protein
MVKHISGQHTHGKMARQNSLIASIFERLGEKYK